MSATARKSRLRRVLIYILTAGAFAALPAAITIYFGNPVFALALAAGLAMLIGTRWSDYHAAAVAGGICGLFAGLGINGAIEYVLAQPSLAEAGTVAETARALMAVCPPDDQFGFLTLANMARSPALRSGLVEPLPVTISLLYVCTTILLTGGSAAVGQYISMLRRRRIDRQWQEK